MAAVRVHFFSLAFVASYRVRRSKCAEVPLALDAICVEDCINRLTQVECLPDDCKGGGFCMNQRCVFSASRLAGARSADTLQVPAAGICENRYRQDGEKGVWAPCGGGHAKVRFACLFCFGVARKAVL